LQLTLEAGTPHWRRSRTLRNQSEEHNAGIYAECNVTIKGRETPEKEDKDDGKKTPQRNTEEKMTTED